MALVDDDHPVAGHEAGGVVVVCERLEGGNVDDAALTITAAAELADLTLRQAEDVSESRSRSRSC